MNRIRAFFQGGMTDDEFRKFCAEFIAYSTAAVLFFLALTVMNHFGALR